MSNESKDILNSFKGDKLPSKEEFERLVKAFDYHNLLAKIFLLEGPVYVFENSPMKYTIFREQVGDRFNIGSQDVCIVGSAKLGFSPSPYEKYGKTFQETSDVDVVIISEELFDEGSRALFATFNNLGPALYAIRAHKNKKGSGNTTSDASDLVVNLDHWASVKEGIRNYTYQNFNPGRLPANHSLRIKIFEKISSTSGLFCALEPQVFVSKIRARIFRNWRAAEDYYANSLRELKRWFMGQKDVDSDDDFDEDMPLQNDEASCRNSKNSVGEVNA